LRRRRDRGTAGGAARRQCPLPSSSCFPSHPGTRAAAFGVFANGSGRQRWPQGGPRGAAAARPPRGITFTRWQHRACIPGDVGWQGSAASASALARSTPRGAIRGAALGHLGRRAPLGGANGLYLKTGPPVPVSLRLVGDLLGRSVMVLNSWMFEASNAARSLRIVVDRQVSSTWTSPALGRSGSSQAGPRPWPWAAAGTPPAARNGFAGGGEAGRVRTGRSRTEPRQRRGKKKNP